MNFEEVNDRSDVEFLELLGNLEVQLFIDNHPSEGEAAVTVTYQLRNSYTSLNFRTFRYTVNNGAPALYDDENPYEPLDFSPPAAELIPANIANLLKKLGVWDLLNMLLRILRQFARSLTNRF